jgi:hypothetical protein
VDVLDLHWYPEARGGNVRITENDDREAVAAARVQAPRSLWDPTYVETSWIAQSVGAIRLLPRMREKIAARYPGTRLAITEYNYGGGRHISGALATADVLGIFGREDVFAAALWGSDDDVPFFHAAFYCYSNFDGQGGRFGEISVAAATSNHEATSVYASVDPGRDDRVAVVVLNKGTGAANATIALNPPQSFRGGRAFQLTSASPALAPGPPLTAVAAGSFRVRLPPSSVVTLELRP